MHQVLGILWMANVCYLYNIGMCFVVLESEVSYFALASRAEKYYTSARCAIATRSVLASVLRRKDSESVLSTWREEWWDGRFCWSVDGGCVDVCAGRK
ncbi:MAG: hypothetical protein BYD32DRAFT_406092 [Podila humilis]|nr:MAG: hypothetical protein BYD32DRAFT_406092 [Podila humilis]